MRTILLLFLATISVNGFSQSIEFSRIYKVWCEFSNNNFEQTSDGGYIICSDAIPEMDTLATDPLAYGYLIKISAFGTPQWMKKFEKSNTNIKPFDGNSVCQTYDGGYAVATCYYRYDSVANQFRTYTYLIKTDALGNHLWSRLYGGIGNSRAFCIKEAQNNDLVICGSTTDSTNASIHGNFLMRTTSNGNVIWAKSFSAGSSLNSGEFSSVSETASGDLILCGNTVQQGLIVRTDANGNVIWSTENNGVMNTDIEEETNGNLVIVGYTNNFSYTLYFEMDSVGTPLYSNYYNTVPYHGSSIIPTWDGATIVGDGNGAGSLLMHISAPGNVLWNATYSDADGMLRPDLERTTDGGYAFAAQKLSTISTTGIDWSVIVVKTDSLGDIPCNDSLASIQQYVFPAPTPVTLMVINGTTMLPISTLMMPVQLHDSDLCANKPDGLIENSLNGSVYVYPNPANDEINIAVNDPPGNNLVITLYDVHGQIVERIKVPVNGDYHGRMELSTHSNGLYFLEIECDGAVLTRQKLIHE